MIELAAKGNIEELSILVLNSYLALNEEYGLCIEAMNINLTGTLTECAIEEVGKVVMRDTGKLSQETKDQAMTLEGMIAYHPVEKVELAALLNFINTLKVAGERKWSAKRIMPTLKN